MINISDLAEHLAQYAEYAFAHKDREELERVLKEYFESLNNGWVSVSERLPKREGSYLVSVERTLCNRLEHMTETILYNGDGYWHLFSGRVIAWQPLPEPYKEEEE